LRRLPPPSPLNTLVLGLAVAALSSAARESASVGFAGREIYEFSGSSFDLSPCDLNGDGLGDLVFVDAGRSRIELLERLPAATADFVDASRKTDGPNRVTYDGRFVNRHHAVELRVLRLAAGDWNGDGRADVAWVTEGGELTVRWSTADGEPRVERRTVDELRAGCVLLEACDCDGDGACDLLAAGPAKLIAFAANADGTLGEPRVLDLVDAGLDRADVCDLDGDGRPDLLYTYLGKDFPFRYRLGGPGGTFGARVDVDLPQVRSAVVRDLDGDGAAEVAAVFRLSGRLSVLGLADLPPAKRTLRRYPLADAGRQARTYAVGDLDGNGTADVVSTHPATSDVTVHSGSRGANRLGSADYPSLVGVAHPRIGDTDGDGRAELLVVSAAERMLGVAVPAEDGSLPFPRTLPLEGEPCALDVADADADGYDDALLVSVKGEGRNREFRVEVWRGGPQGIQGPPAVHPIAGMKKEPAAVRARDLDRDGAVDLLAFMPGERAAPMLLFQQRPDGFRGDERGEDTPGLGMLAGAGPQSVGFADVDGDGRAELLAASGNFARALTLAADESGRTTPAVVAQFPGPTPDARIVACALADLDGDGSPELVLRDEHNHELLVLEYGPDGPGALRQRVAAGRLEFAGLEVADVDSDGRQDLVVLGAGQIGLVLGGAAESTLEERASYDPPLEETFLDQLVAGDFTGDGRSDLVASELSENSLLIVASGDAGLTRSLGFEVFEKSALSGDQRTREPRELACRDIDGDGKADLALLVHDKLIVYLQE